MSRQELIKLHDAEVSSTSVGLGYFRDEVFRRDQLEVAARMQRSSDDVATHTNNLYKLVEETEVRLQDAEVRSEERERQMVDMTNEIVRLTHVIRNLTIVSVVVALSALVIAVLS
jgi:hypothetical protein